MGLFGGIVKIALSPIAGVAEVIDDVSGRNSESEQAFGIGSLGVSSFVKGTAKGIKSGSQDIFGSDD